MPETTERQLFHIRYSPWSQRARWALDHHRVAYESTLYTPTIDEPRMRIRLRRPFGRVSVPILFADGEVIDDSWDIARHAEAVGGGEPLFFDLEAARYWNGMADKALSAGRQRAIATTLRDPEAQRDALHGIFPSALHTALRPVAVFAAKQLARKYPSGPAADLEDALEKWRDALDGKPFLLDRLSYADITMAVTLEFVRPGSQVRRSEIERRVWTDARLASRYADLLEWRDRLVADHWPDRVR